MRREDLDYIINILRNNHDITYRHVAKEFGTSRQRIQQILEKHAPYVIEERRIARTVFCLCGNQGIKYHKDYLCKKCFKEKIEANKLKWAPRFDLDGCKECGSSKQKHQGHGLCRKCYSKWGYHNIPGKKEKVAIRTRQWQNKNPERMKEITKKAVLKYIHSEHGHKKVLENSKKQYYKLKSTPEGLLKLKQYNKNKYLRQLKKDPIEFIKYLERRRADQKAREEFTNILKKITN